MASLLDSILDATAGRTGDARVVSSQHDTSKINWARGLSDPGEMIACGYLPEARRRAGESDNAYQARLEAMDMPNILGAERMSQLLAAANKRASYDTTGGYVHAVFAGKPAWSELGVVLDGTFSSAEAMEHARLTFKIEKRPMFRRMADGSYVESTDQFETVRADTQKSFGACGPLYTPIQIAEQFKFLDGVISEFGAKYESAGSLYGGEQVFIMAHLPKQDFKINGSTMKAYAAFINFNRQGKASRCFATDTRLECANTCRIAINKDAEAGLSIRHTGDIRQKMADARTALGLTVKGIDEFHEQAAYMHKTPADIMRYAPAVLDLVCEVTAAQAAQGADVLARSIMATETNADFEKLVKKINRQIDKRESIMEQIIEATQAADAPAPGTLWSGYNAVTRVATHGKIGKESQDNTLRAERRFESLLVGERDRYAQAALQVALQN